MTLTVLRPADYVTTQWSGGATTQLAIAPVGAVYADRDFLWRVSSATVELEESDFTPLPDYRRFISTVRGDMTLSHNGGAELTLRPGDVHEFDGGDDTHSRGRCSVFNLMLRKGGADGTMSCLRLSGKGKFTPEAGMENVLLFCAAGGGSILRDGGDTLRFSAGEAILAQQPDNAPLALDCVAGTMLMIAQTRGCH